MLQTARHNGGRPHSLRLQQPPASCLEDCHGFMVAVTMTCSFLPSSSMPSTRHDFNSIRNRQMEIHGNLMGHSHGNGSRDHQNGSSSWASVWELHSSRLELDWTTSNLPYVAAATLPTAASGSSYADRQAESGGEVLWLPNSSEDHRRSLYSGNVTGQFHPDPHLMCLKLGKRNYFEDSTSPGERHVVVGGGFSSIGKRGKALFGGDGGASSSFPATVPRCQVEGCQVALVNAKDYHRRHKVCEMHSKAPKVVVLGLEQRFCQQCSRFHVVSEFDDSKRSCRRRLAGHNERRRKSSHDSLAKNCFPDNKAVTGRFPYCHRQRQDVLSLFCHQRPSLSRSLEINALRELIAENRAAIIARQLVLDRDMHAAGSDHHCMEEFGSSASCIAFQQNPTLPENHCWDRIHENGEHVTLDLMQAPNSGFGMLSARGKSKDEEEDEDTCTGLWNSFNGGHVI